MSAPADNRQVIREAFASWEEGDSRPFFALVDDEVRWTVIGSTPISGTYDGKRAFLSGPVTALTDRLTSPLRATVADVSADGDKVFVQWSSSASSANGVPYEQTYCWVLTMHDGGVTEVVAYLDTELVANVLA